METISLVFGFGAVLTLLLALILTALWRIAAILERDLARLLERVEEGHDD
jgi:hypothetical protein